MKKIVICSALFAVVTLASCGGKNEKNEFSKPADTEVTTSEEVVPVVEETPVVADNAEEGKAIFEGKGTCVACHLPDKKVVGPSLKEIATIYKEKDASIVTFLKGEGEAIVDPSQFEVMKANFAITKQMSDEELLALESYIYSFQ